MFYNSTKRSPITILAFLCSLSMKETVTSNENFNMVHEVISGKLCIKKLSLENYDLNIILLLYALVWSTQNKLYYRAFGKNFLRKMPNFFKKKL